MSAELLARAFANDPLMRYILDHSEDRHRNLVAIFACAIRACQIRGDIARVHGANGQIAAATWLPVTGIPVEVINMIRSGMIWMPFAVGPSAMVRMQRHEAPCERLIRRRLPETSGYLWSVGVEPSAMGQGAGREVIAIACAQMMEGGLTHCVLKTENEANVTFYEHLNFRTCETISDPRSNLRSWVMVKPLELEPSVATRQALGRTHKDKTGNCPAVDNASGAEGTIL